MPEPTGEPGTAPPAEAPQPAEPADDSYVIVTPVEVVVTPIPAEEPPAPPEGDEDTVLADVEASGSTTEAAAQPGGGGPDPDAPDPDAPDPAGTVAAGTHSTTEEESST
ncbi:hypothetical protein [Streptomyces similanensis]|uniref:Uncharacterized protein n=1 Tax=Streptomyces similanensis TaxID=1274988 RepID=A0ABP9KEE9_9ACTN